MSIPPDIWRHIASFLRVRCILRLSQVNRSAYSALQYSLPFWNSLHMRLLGENDLVIISAIQKSCFCQERNNITQAIEGANNAIRHIGANYPSTHRFIVDDPQRMELITANIQLIELKYAYDDELIAELDDNIILPSFQPLIIRKVFYALSEPGKRKFLLRHIKYNSTSKLEVILNTCFQPLVLSPETISIVVILILSVPFLLSSNILSMIIPYMSNIQVVKCFYKAKNEGKIMTLLPVLLPYLPREIIEDERRHIKICIDNAVSTYDEIFILQTLNE